MFCARYFECLCLTTCFQKYIRLVPQAGINTDTKVNPDTLTSEPGAVSEPEAGAKGNAQITLSRWNTRLKVTALVVGICSIAIGIGIGLPLLATPTMLDVFWIVLMTFQTGIMIRSVCRAFYSHHADKLISCRRSTLHYQILESCIFNGPRGIVSHGQPLVLIQSHRCQTPRRDLSPPCS